MICYILAFISLRSGFLIVTIGECLLSKPSFVFCGDLSFVSKIGLVEVVFCLCEGERVKLVVGFREERGDFALYI